MGKRHLRTFRRVPYFTGLAAAAAIAGLLSAAPARAEDGAGAYVPMPGPATLVRPAPRRWWADPYRPAVPVAESRAAIVVAVMPITPFLGSQGEAGTPRRGQVGVSIERLSDERTLQDNRTNVYASDGEVQLTRVEIVSPRYLLFPGRWRIPVHYGATLQGYSLHGALFDGLRNWVEESLLGGDPDALEHDLGGRALQVTTLAGETTDLLGETPLLKLKAFAKFPLGDVRVGRSCLSTALSVGLGTPSVGKRSEAGNSTFQPEITFAWALPFGDFRWTGAATGSWSGGSELYHEIDQGHEHFIFGAFTNIEWWVSSKFAIGTGFSWMSPATTDSGLPTDLHSFYWNLGILYRLSCRSDLHLLFSENPEGNIINQFGADFSNSQKNADFSLTLGWRLSL